MVRPARAHRPRDAPHGDARGPRHDEFASRARFPNPINAPINARSQQLERLLGQIQEREQEGVGGTVVADSDIALLADETNTRPMSSGRRAPWPRTPAPCDTDIGRAYSRLARLSKHQIQAQPRPRGAPTTPRPPRQFAFFHPDLGRESRFEYTKYTTMANPTRAYRPAAAADGSTHATPSAQRHQRARGTHCSCLYQTRRGAPQFARRLVSGSCGPITSAA